MRKVNLVLVILLSLFGSFIKCKIIRSGFNSLFIRKMLWHILWMPILFYPIICNLLISTLFTKTKSFYSIFCFIIFFFRITSHNNNIYTNNSRNSVFIKCKKEGLYHSLTRTVINSLNKKTKVKTENFLSINKYLNLLR